MDKIQNPKVELPMIQEGSSTVWHQFVIRCKNGTNLTEYLFKNGIVTIIHYPIPLHLSEAFSELGYQEGNFPITEQYAREVLSIPLFNGMTEGEK